ncbi:hypothetical protein P170DRAFT_177738 [Aspergillus steynii IBT 23096]|uniref:Uncharacterized protein n=1 Tax=Aspergillus steynii IBT 23096 TaxID=1392250 RepID=A0A2I2G8N5_9EURO|nr:uncharacterized protein P170DRAFT_177738 [Aspergillus steynii IBT 23096]PLB49218.1 hypothetical protein P170DRAFT_177738 [Aspergillus steynii IBT 23096]
MSQGLTRVGQRKIPVYRLCLTLGPWDRAVLVFFGLVYQLPPPSRKPSTCLPSLSFSPSIALYIDPAHITVLR